MACDSPGNGYARVSTLQSCYSTVKRWLGVCVALRCLICRQGRSTAQHAPLCQKFLNANSNFFFTPKIQDVVLCDVFDWNPLKNKHTTFIDVFVWTSTWHMSYEIDEQIFVGLILKRGLTSWSVLVFFFEFHCHRESYLDLEQIGCRVHIETTWTKI